MMLPPNLAEYKRIGIALEALLWAFAGGWVACFFASRTARENAPQAATTPQPDAQAD
jgi:hypothetical protein